MAKNFEDISYKVMPKLDIILKINAVVDKHKNSLQNPITDKDALIRSSYIMGVDKKVRGWFFHQDLLAIIGEYELSRYCMLVNMRAARDQDDSISVCHFVFTTDKSNLAIIQGLSPDALCRLDTFVCSDDGNGNFRKNGTIKGNLMHKQLKRESARESNKKLLHTLMFGGYNTEHLLTCAYSGVVVEDITITDYILNTEKTVNEYELHHVTFMDRESIGKTDSPSEHLNRYKLHEMPHLVLIELLSCVVLSASRHSSLHKACAADDIMSWKKRWNNGELSYMPWHWQNEENYNNTLNRISNMCPLFRKELALSYAEFIESNTLNISPARLEELLNKINPKIESTLDTMFQFYPETNNEPDQCLIA